MAELIQVYCGYCNEQAEVEFSFNWDPIPILMSDPEPSHNVIGTIKCLGCDAKNYNVTIREGHDEGYELMWLWEMMDYETEQA